MASWRRGVVLRVAESCCSLHIIDPHLMFDRRLANRRLSSRWLGRCRWPRDMVTYPFPLFVLGVMKAGTTALCHRLFQHPSLVTAHPIAGGAPPELYM